MLHLNDWDKVYTEQSDYTYMAFWADELYATPYCQEAQRFPDLPYCTMSDLPTELLIGQVCPGDLVLL